jgi:cell division protein FtsQ
VVAILVVGTLAFLRSPYFALDHVSIGGRHHLSEARVLRVAGLREGANLVSFDAAAAAQRLEGDPWIAAATITKDLPDAVTITIRERVPLAAAEGTDGWAIVAADGTELATQTSRPHLPILLPAGGDDATRTGSLAVLAPMAPELGSRVDSVTDVDGEVTLSLDDGVRVAYGTVTETDAKAQSLSAVLSWSVEEGVDVVEIDVRVPGAPTARLSSGGTVTP